MNNVVLKNQIKMIFCLIERKPTKQGLLDKKQSICLDCYNLRDN